MDEDDEAQPWRGRNRLLHLTKNDLSSIPAREARELLTKYEPLVRGFVRRFPKNLFCARFDEDDLYSVGQTMLLQFWVLYDGRGSFHGWATFLFRQSFLKIRKDLETNPEVATSLFSSPAEGSSGGPLGDGRAGSGEFTSTRSLARHIVGSRAQWMLEHASSNDIEERLAANEETLEMERFRRALTKLSSRHRFILEGLADGRTTAQIGQDLGITRQRVDQIRVVAMAAIRAALAADDEEEDDLDEDEPCSQAVVIVATLAL